MYEIFLSGTVPNRKAVEKYIDDNRSNLTVMAGLENPYLSRPETIVVSYNGKTRNMQIYKKSLKLEKIGSIKNPWQFVYEKIKKNPNVLTHKCSTYELAQEVFTSEELKQFSRDSVIASIKKHPNVLSIKCSTYELAQEVFTPEELKQLSRDSVIASIKKHPDVLSIKGSTYELAQEVFTPEELDNM